MKNISDIVNEQVNESRGWNPSFSSHKKAYNDLVKWYEKVCKVMDEDEAIDLLNTAISDIKNACLYPIE